VNILAKELRIKGTELRTLEGENLNIEGYVNAVGRESELLFSAKKGKWFKEIMEPGVFKRALENNIDIPMLLEHDYSKEIARTSNGTLELTEDSIGLKFKATITDEELYSSIKNGEINSCSFGFVCEEEEIEFVSNREEKRYVKGIQLLEVSLVKNPAYIGSLVEARNMESALQELGISRKENTVDKTKNQESRAYCSYIWDTHDAVNCCLELMACATSLLTYKENSNSEIQALSRDILSKIGAYMVELTETATEERNLDKEVKKEEVVETETQVEEETVVVEEERAKGEEETEKSEKDAEPKEEQQDDVSEEETKEIEEKEDSKEEEEKEESENRNKISPEDEILLIRAKLSNLK
jgi:HK97 family phage prohead protease